MSTGAGCDVLSALAYAADVRTLPGRQAAEECLCEGLRTDRAQEKPMIDS